MFLAMSLSLAGGVGLLVSPSEAVTLEDYEVHTVQDNIKVILHTDERAKYSTETNGKQFSIILHDAQLSDSVPPSKEARGAAAPKTQATQEGGKVKITLTNVPTSRYAISVLQKPASSSSAERPAQKMAMSRGVETSTDSAPQPRRSVFADRDDALDAIVNRFQSTASSPVYSSPESGYQPLGESAAIQPAVDRPTRRASRPKRVTRKATSTAVAAKKPSPAPTVAVKPKPAPPSTGEAIAAVAVADPGSLAQEMETARTETPAEGSQPASVNANVPSAILTPEGPLEVTEPVQESVASTAEPVPPQPAEELNWLQQARLALYFIPNWGLWAIGIVCLLASAFISLKVIGSLLKLLNLGSESRRVLNLPPHLSSLPDEEPEPSLDFAAASPVMPTAGNTRRGGEVRPSSASYAFQDTSRVNASQYLLGSDVDMREAVRNTVRLKYATPPVGKKLLGDKPLGKRLDHWVKT
jgi:hypothetical protein